MIGPSLPYFRFNARTFDPREGPEARNGLLHAEQAVFTSASSLLNES
jgi:hypothetical protein